MAGLDIKFCSLLLTKVISMKIFAEILLSISIAMNAALLTFIAGVLRRVMNDMDAPTFRLFVNSLVRHSKKSPFMLAVVNLPLIGAIPFTYFYGFHDRWIIAGIAVWLGTGVAAKLIKVPVYRRIASLEGSDVARLGQERMKLNNGNLLQAILNSVAAGLMMLTFVA